MITAVVRKYKYATLADYFEAQKSAPHTAGSRWSVSDRDTHERMAERHGVSQNTISRIVNGLANPSFTLAIALAEETDVDPAGMGIPRTPARKAGRGRGRKR